MKPLQRPETPAGYRIVTRGKLLPGDRVYLNLFRGWSSPQTRGTIDKQDTASKWVSETAYWIDNHFRWYVARPITKRKPTRPRK